MSTPAQHLLEHAPWLLEPSLGVCAVGSTALVEACRRAGIAGPGAADLDLSWALDVEAGSELLERHGVVVATTTANRERGTLAARIGDRRIEITSFRGRRDGTLEQRLVADLGERDMTVGALAWWLSRDQILDPLGGLDDWRSGRIRACGDPGDRVREHPIRWLRYYRRAHQWGFELDAAIRKLPSEPELLARIPPEALGAEVRAALLHCPSPGRFFHELFEAGLLEHVAPELAPQFDGRPAGPVRHHPEVGQALHMILALEWIHERTAHLAEPDRLAAAVAVLCHDLGKGLTDAEDFPAHHGHEATGIPLVDSLLDRLVGLADAYTRRLAEAVSRLHQVIRQFDQLSPGKKASLYDRYFRGDALRADLFALAVGADSGGRLGREDEGSVVATRVQKDVTWLRERCGQIDAGAIRQRFPDDVSAFRAALHQARAEALRRR